MAVCTHTSGCELFPMISVNSALRVWRTFYCEGKWHECARYKLSLKSKPVAQNLLPNGKFIDLAVVKPQAVAKPAPSAARVAAAAAPVDTMSYYLRMQIHSGAGVMAEIIRSLGQRKVRIDAVTEKKGRNESAPSYLMVLIDQIDEPTLNEAVAGLQGLGCVEGEIKRVALEKMADGRLL
ncbi:MAG: hypothetical protein V3R65_06740 [Acidiferrobacterales bacterium]